MAARKSGKDAAKAFIETARRMKAIRRLSRVSPVDTIGARLKTIEELASGKKDPADLKRRIESIDEIRKRRDASKARKEDGGQDRKERGGHDRAG